MKNGLLVLILLLQISCAMKMKKDTSAAIGTDVVPMSWETKASIRDLRKNKTNQVTIDIVAIKNHKLRMEASATLGYQVGSLVMNQNEFVAIIYPQKKIFKGPLNEKSLARTFNLPIPPSALYAIAYDEVIRGQNWKCQVGENKIVSLCENGIAKVEWLNRKHNTKLVKISSATVDMSWFFKAPERKELTPELFEAELPTGYQTQEIK